LQGTNDVDEACHHRDVVINEAPANDDEVLECASLSIVDVLRNNNVMVHVAPTTTIVIVCRGLHDLASLPPRSSCMTRSSSFLSNY
jgi:hypothetical protein